MAKKQESRYTVGIDLGTTNTVLSYVDHASAEMKPQALPIPQIVAQGELQALVELPSFLYMPLSPELGKGLYRLPWGDAEPSMVIGRYALERASEAPSRVVYSSKSWLCSERIERHSACLPLDMGDGEEVPRISPVDAACFLLEYLRDAWNYLMAKEDSECRLENQTCVITVPASFDAVARDLTVEAAQKAGLQFTLLEEPQAAFYSWLAEHGKDWREHVSDGDVVLVCDIGGGTTDFSLIAVTDNAGELELQRLAVGNHTLLGGDNMDVTLAYSMSRKLAEEKKIRLDAHQMTALTHACRKAKEALGNGATEAQPLTILGRGSRLFGGTIKTSISGEELRAALLDGFFPVCSVDTPVASGRRTGLRTLSLDYELDPAFTHHLARFLSLHSFKDGNGRPIPPGVVLFNGGVTRSPLFRGRLAEVLDSWRPAGGGQVLEESNPDLAVANGAAWFAHVRRCGGIRIKAGSARSYYIGIESPMPAIPGFVPPVDALCVVNHGMEEGTELPIACNGLALVVGEPTDFRFFTSTTRQSDAAGDRLQDWQEDELAELPPLTVSLEIDADKGERPGTLVPVTLRTVLTDIGTLQLWCDEVQGNRHWKLEFGLRDNEAVN